MATDITAPGDGAVRTDRLAATVRDIAAGGLAGLIVGLVVGGLGGRLIMRLAAILAPDTIGRFTENGNRIGTVTAEGTALLIVFGGLLAGVVAGGLWVVVRPWLPVDRSRRLLVSVPLALAFGSPLLIDGSNPDFAILRHDPVVVASLLALVALAGPVLVVVDAWLDRRLPAATVRRSALAFYTLIAAVGLLLTLFLTIPAMAQTGSPIVLIAIVCVGLATLLHWAERLAGRAPTPPMLERIARSALIVAVALGLGKASLDVLAALGLR